MRPLWILIVTLRHVAKVHCNFRVYAVRIRHVTSYQLLSNSHYARPAVFSFDHVDVDTRSLYLSLVFVFHLEYSKFLFPFFCCIWNFDRTLLPFSKLNGCWTYDVCFEFITFAMYYIRYKCTDINTPCTSSEWEKKYYSCSLNFTTIFLRKIIVRFKINLLPFLKTHVYRVFALEKLMVRTRLF